MISHHIFPELAISATDKGSVIQTARSLIALLVHFLQAAAATLYSRFIRVSDALERTRA